MNILRVVMYVLMAQVILMITWLSVPTSTFISDVETIIDGHEITFKRLTPFGEVHARWREEITMIGSGFECRKPRWETSTFQVEKSNVVRYTIGDWAYPCLDMDEPFTHRSVRQAYLFGVIPLRPSQTVSVHGMGGDA